MGNFNSCVCLHEPTPELLRSQDWTHAAGVMAAAGHASNQNSRQEPAVTLDMVESRRLTHKWPEPPLRRVATGKPPLMLVTGPLSVSSPGEHRESESPQVWDALPQNHQDNHLLRLSHQFNSPDRLFSSQQINLTSPDRTISKHVLDMTFRDPNASHQWRETDQHNSRNHPAAILAHSLDYRGEVNSPRAPKAVTSYEEVAQQKRGGLIHLQNTMQDSQQGNPGYANYVPIQISFGQEDQFRIGNTPRFLTGLDPANRPPTQGYDTNNQMRGSASRGQQSAIEPVDNVKKCRQTLKMIESK